MVSIVSKMKGDSGTDVWMELGVLLGAYGKVQVILLAVIVESVEDYPRRPCHSDRRGVNGRLHFNVLSHLSSCQPTSTAL